MVMNILRKLFGGEVPSDVLERERTQLGGLVKPRITSVERTSPHTKIIEEIHESFAMASMNALKRANEILGRTPGVSKSVQELVSLGFSNVKAVVEAKNDTTIRETAEKSAKTIVYFQQKYPTYKFITPEQVTGICSKYGLVHANVDRYKGEVPEKNIADMVRFKSIHIDPSDRAYKSSHYRLGSHPITYQEYMRSRESTIGGHGEYCTEETKFSICAPAKDMDLSKLELKNGKYQDIPDPVVLYPVREGYLIVTAWGDEASDGMVVNQQMN